MLGQVIPLCSWRIVRSLAYCPSFSCFFCSLFFNFHLLSTYHHLSSLLTHRLVSSPSQAACASLTAVTLSLYSFILERLPPTPSRFHYIFNLRDLSRIFEGLCLSTPDKFATPAHFLRLWRNECLRIFHDRLISEEDKAVVQTKIRELVNDKYGMHADSVLQDPILFGDYRLALKVGGRPSSLESLVGLNGKRLGRVSELSRNFDCTFLRSTPAFALFLERGRVLRSLCGFSPRSIPIISTLSSGEFLSQIYAFWQMLWQPNLALAHVSSILVMLSFFTSSTSFLNLPSGSICA